ncbi:MAG: DOMON-like domain-containing protein [Scytonema sp. PMC 1069.18]|nr:DOMON-like domain-containing protein [Scytonema sp. PMC 1069.18]MEC4881115.1 DOMON-like domain-containing protein [Scytonema sp. PMC 1070.18]
MNEQTFSLYPFPSTKSLPKLKIAGNIARYDNQLTITYALFGDLQQVVIPSVSDIPTRKHELWKDTCFEFFIGVQDSEQYWEFNLSPTGDWNVYHFNGYRQGMQEETDFTTLPFSIYNQADSVTLAINIDLDKIISLEQSLDVAIASVIKHNDGEDSYWALTHQGEKPDFHLRDSFTIKL